MEKNLTLNVFAGTTGQSRRLEALEIVVVHNHIFEDDGNGMWLDENGKQCHTAVCKICGEKVTHKLINTKTFVESGAHKNEWQGYKYTCLVDDFETEEVIQKDVHTYVYDDNGDGTHTKKCSVCNEIFDDAEEHNYGEPITKPATEKEHGENKYICKDCGNTKTEVIHYAFNLSNEKEATCPVHGYVGQINCKVCGIILQKNQRTRLFYDKEPTCTESGYKNAWMCNVNMGNGSVCKEILCGKLDALGHQESYACKKDNSGNCIQHQKVCSRCNVVLSDWENCTFEDWRPEVSENKHSKTCTVCKGKYTEDCQEYVTKEAVTATCNKKGLTEEKQCSVCGKITEPQTEIKINPDNHNQSRLSYAGDSENHYAFCMDCHKQLAKESHTYGEWKQSNDAEKNNGIFVKYCTKCNIPVYQTSLKNALQDAKTSTNHIVAISDFTVKAETVSVPAGVTLEISGDFKANDNTTITNKGNIVIKENASIDSNTISQIQNEGDGKVTMEVKDNSKFNEALKKDYVTDIFLTDNVSKTDQGYEIESGKQLTIDLNGKAFERTNQIDHSNANDAGTTGILNKGKITIKNGTLKDNDGSQNTVIVSNDGGDAELTLENVTVEGGDYGVFNKDGELTITGNSKITSKTYGIAVAGTNSKLNVTGSEKEPISISAGSMGISTHGQGSNVTVNVSYANITSNGVAAYLPAAESTVTFKNCTMQGKGGIEALAGTIKVENCTITATGSKVETGEVLEEQKDGSVCDGSAIFLRSQTGYGKYDDYGSNEDEIKLNISNSILTPGTNSKQVRVHKSSKGAGVENVSITSDDAFVTVDLDKDINGVNVTVNGIKKTK